MIKVKPNYYLRNKSESVDRSLSIELTKLLNMGYPIEIELPIEIDEDLDWDVDDEEEDY